MVDPFGERTPGLMRERLYLLGARCDFESDSRELLELVKWAYADLPRHRLSARAPQVRIRLKVASATASPTQANTAVSSDPPPLQLHAGADLLAAVTGPSTFVALSPTELTALIVVSPEMLASPYHVRYELIEFAVFTLASRAQGLTPLHAACIGYKGRGLLVVGDSGAGKSTLTLHSLLNGFDFVAEDSVFVHPKSLLATGVGNFLHVRADSLRFLAEGRDRSAIEKSPVIRRRSGVEKFEVDVRRLPHRIARKPLKLAAIIFATAKHRGPAPTLEPLRRRAMLEKLNTTQPYGASRPEWSAFRSRIARLPAFELYRGEHPLEAIPLLRDLCVSR